MSETKPAFIAPRLVAGLLLVSALSLLAFLMLSAYAPDLRPERSGSANALSKSAIGFAGLRLLLEQSAVPAELRRDPLPCTGCSLLVLTPEIFDESGSLSNLARPGSRLVILPKWATTPMPLNSAWVTKIDVFPNDAVADVLSALSKDVKIARRSGTARVKLAAKDARFAADIPASPVPVDRLQTISGKDLEPRLVDDKGQAILAQLRGTQIYILADPDFANNQGLAAVGPARLAYGLVQSLRADARPVAFDLTLNGFARSPDLLRTVFSPPFLGATLCAVIAAAFILFHALSRFGAPRRIDRAFAFGKRALADNTAAVIRLMRREPQMAPRYGQAMLRLVGLQAGIARERLSEPGWIGILEKRAGAPYRFADLNAEAGTVRDTAGLMKVAVKLYQWRQRVLHEHR